MDMTTKKEIKVSAFRFYGQEIFYHALTGMVLPNTFQGTCAIYFPGEGESFFEVKIVEGERNWKCIGNSGDYIPVWC